LQGKKIKKRGEIGGKNMVGEKRKSEIQRLEGEERGRASPALKSVKKQESVGGSVRRGEEGHHQKAADPEMEAAMRRAGLDTLKKLPRADDVARLFGMAGQCATPPRARICADR
jgi:hypothetical protein